MTKETFEKARQLSQAMITLEYEISLIVAALNEQAKETCYSKDTLNIKIYHGCGNSTTVIVPRQLVIEMLDSANDMYQNEKAKLQAEFDEM